MCRRVSDGGGQRKRLLKLSKQAALASAAPARLLLMIHPTNSPAPIGGLLRRLPIFFTRSASECLSQRLHMRFYKTLPRHRKDRERWYSLAYRALIDRTG
ncbi:hypothetical protein PM082_010192 [Marasmius tenuissimus]|nr:hypothetical protein PM082_010192 [Marasmius tenuissimus]